MRRGKKLRRNLIDRQKQWDAFDERTKKATTRPGSEHK